MSCQDFVEPDDKERLEAEARKQEKLDSLRSKYFPDGLYDESGKKLVTDIISKLNTLGGPLQRVQAFAYEGFCAADMMVALTACSINCKLFFAEMCFLLGIFFLRGPNITNVTKKCKASDEDKKYFNSIISRYNVVASAKGSSTAVTLPRISLTLPGLALRVYKHMTTVNTMIDPSQIGAPFESKILFYGFALAGLKNNSNDLCLYIHNVYQVFMVHITSKKRGIKKLDMDNAVKFSDIAIASSFATKQEINEIKTILSKIKLPDLSEMHKLSSEICSKGARWPSGNIHHKAFNTYMEQLEKDTDHKFLA